MFYRRADIKGATYFFTVNLADRRSILLVDKLDVLRAVMNKVKQTHPFKIDALVILPDHIHALWTLPAGDNDYSIRWMLIKAGFSRQIPKTEKINKSRAMKGERGIWQRRYWEHLIRDERDYEIHVNYIHNNPVKHGYANCAVNWPYSSIHQFISKGEIEPNWGREENRSVSLDYGER